MSQEITKRMFWRHVNIKINRAIHHYHVFAIISILLEEMINELVSGKEINIFNFGSLVLKDTTPRRYHNLVHRKIMYSSGKKILKFSISKNFRQKLVNYLEVDDKIIGD